ncbi:MAG: HAD family hydrolase [Acidimicrobiales bacterium]
MGAQLAVFDGDDTLWLTELLYDEARQAARRIVAAAGADPVRWEAVERRLDVENVARFGFSAERFPTSCVEAYRAVASPLLPAVEVEVRLAAEAVFTAPAPLVPDARAVLEALAASHRLVLLTKGDADVQRQRLETSGLGDLFADVEIVLEKGHAHFSSLLSRFGASPSLSWSIGNSLRSDIEPALAAGLRAVWIDADVWEYERHRPGRPDHPGLLVASALAEVPELIEAALVR